MFKISNQGERAEVYLYGTIGDDFWGDGNSAKEFASQLNELSPKPLDIRIDSGGGDVYEAFAICSAIQRYEGETTAYVDGIAASAAIYIAVVCDKVIMNDYAWLMAHNAWCYTCGNANELAQVIERLNQIDATIRDIIAKRSGMTAEEVSDYMEQETWFSAEDAVEKGLCQEVVETEERMAACITQELASKYRNVPRGVAITGCERNSGKAVDCEPRSTGSPENTGNRSGNEPTSYTVSNITESSQEAKSAEQEGPAYVLLDGRVYERNANAEL